MNYKTIKFTKRGKVATITLNNYEENRNALNKKLCGEMLDCLNRCCNADPDVRAIILTGSRGVFCSGGQLAEIIEQRADSQLMAVKELLNIVHPMISELRRTRAPIIAAVNGAAPGGGLALTIACDLAIAAKSAWFNAKYILLATSPDCGMSYQLPRIVGSKRAAWLFYTGDTLNAQEAYEMGIVNKVVDDRELLNEANVLAKRLAAGPSLAIANLKELLNLSINENVETQMEIEKQMMARLCEGDDYAEGLKAFLEKRKPKFKGR